MGEIVRLQKYIAMSGTASRRAAEVMISEGRVGVNGKTVTEQGLKVEIGSDTVTVDGVPVAVKDKKYYIMLNKPVGYVTTVKDQFERPTVIDLVKRDISTRIFPVGRLDYDTEGLLILTNDGDFTYRITHPKFHMDKTYLAVVKGNLSISDLNKLRRGIKADGFTASPAKVELIDSQEGRYAVRITIHEGKNRQVRRMFEAVGCTVIGLRREKIGIVELGNLPLGRWRHLTSHEVNFLMGK